MRTEMVPAKGSNQGVEKKNRLAPVPIERGTFGEAPWSGSRLVATKALDLRRTSLDIRKASH